MQSKTDAIESRSIHLKAAVLLKQPFDLGQTITQCQRGDPLAWEALVKQHQARLVPALSISLGSIRRKLKKGRGRS